MTSPGRYRSDPPDISEAILRLERRVQALEANPRAGNTTIDTGAFQVKDASGSVRMRMGLLSDGSYGIEVKEDGQENFHQVPYVYTSFVTSASGDTCSSTTYGDLANFGPSVTVPVRSTGRILIIASAQAQSLAGAGGSTILHDARFDVAFSGANTRNPNEAADPLVGIDSRILNTSTGTVSQVPKMVITAQATFEGLTAGLTTITMKYARASGVQDDPEFFRRNLTVITL
jgi:hypothetical protein